MGRLLDEHSVHVRDPPARVLFDETARSLRGEKIAVNAAGAPRGSEPVPQEPALESLLETCRFALWDEHKAAGRFVGMGASRVGVSVQSSDPLEQDVDRAEIGDEQVCVDIERLLEGLCADDYAAAGFPVFAEGGLDAVVEEGAVFGREAAMVEGPARRRSQPEERGSHRAA